MQSYESITDLKEQNTQLETKAQENAMMQDRVKELAAYNSIIWELVRRTHQCDVRDILRVADYEIPFDILRRMPSEICLTTVIFKNQGSVINCMEAISRKYCASEIEKVAKLNKFTDYEKFAARYIEKVDYYHNRSGITSDVQKFFETVGYENFLKDFSEAKTKFLQNNKWGTNLYGYESPEDSYAESDSDSDSD
jgi:hypothetical protein